MTEQATEPAAEVDLLELEIARKVVLPRLQDLAKTVEFRSKNHMYTEWVDKWGQLSRAKFDTWLDLLGITFEKVTRIRGLFPEVQHMEAMNRFHDQVFDNESDGDL